MNFAFRGTRRNELFLTNSVNQNIEMFRPIYNWFKNQLELIAPDTRFGFFEQFIQEEHPLYEQFNTVLSELDTGISRVGGEEVNFDSLPIPESLKQDLRSKVKEGDTVRIMGGDTYRFLVTRKEGQLVAQKIVTYHKFGNAQEVKFDLAEESDGTRRVIDLLPAFLKLAEHKHPKVFVFDELDRSLHTLLTQHFLKTFLNSCNQKTRSQMLFTTHDVLVMDQNTMRRDEMWVTERDETGNSVLFSFSNYKDVRYDKDLQKSYLQGRLGGVPRILRQETQSVASPSSQYRTKDAG